MPYSIINTNLNFIIIPLALGALFKIKRLVYLVVVCFLLYLVYFIFSTIKIQQDVTDLNSTIVSVFAAIVSFGVSSLFLYLFGKLLDMEKTDSVAKLKNAESGYKDIDEKYMQIRMDNENLENKVSEIADLYQIAKKMSEVLEFDQIFQVLGNILSSFKFTNCKLILLQETRTNYEILKIYQIPSAEKKSQSYYEQALLEVVFNNKEPVLISSQTDPNREKLHLGAEMSTFFAQPLVMREKLEAILVLENLPAIDFKKVLIIGGLLAMHLERISLYELVQQLAITDGLTGVFSRRYFMERLDEELKRSSRFNTNLAYLMIDIDHFKDYNDKYGHLVGDVVLKEIARIFKNNIRQLDLIGRYGGEEFSIILPETNKENAAVVADRLREAVQQYIFKAYDETTHVNISIGESVFPEDAEDLQQLIDKADQALYKAKQTGRNRVCIYNKD